MRVVAAFLRRKRTSDDVVPPRTAPYEPSQYELLMLSRPETPMVESRGFPLGPVRYGEDPARTVQREMFSWGKRLQEQNGLEQRGLRGKIEGRGATAVPTPIFKKLYAVSPSF